MSPAPTPAQLRLIRWSEYQAGTMLAVAALALLQGPPALAAAAMGASFGTLIAWSRGEWTPGGSFGAANATTLLRLFALLGLLAWPGLALLPRLLLALAVLLLDGVDGWLARRHGLCSEFGEYFDKEVDAAFTLVLGMLLLREGRFGPWILIPGGLRYAFVLFVRFARPPGSRETGTTLGKVVCVVTLAALMVCLLPIPRGRAALALAATLLLCGSFALSVRELYREG